MGEMCSLNLSHFDCEMIVGAKWAGLTNSISLNVLEFSHTQMSLEFSQNRVPTTKGKTDSRLFIAGIKFKTNVTIKKMCWFRDLHFLNKFFFFIFKFFLLMYLLFLILLMYLLYFVFICNVRRKY